MIVTSIESTFLHSIEKSLEDMAKLGLLAKVSPLLKSPNSSLRLEALNVVALLSHTGNKYNQSITPTNHWICSQPLLSFLFSNYLSILQYFSSNCKGFYFISIDQRFDAIFGCKKDIRPSKYSG